MITGFIKGQTFRLSPSPLVVSDTIDYLTAVFVFRTADWDGAEKWAHFQQGDTVYDIQLKDDKIEENAHLNLSDGKWKVWIHGNRYDGEQVTQRITTEVAEISVKSSGVLNNEPFASIPASAGEQIVAQARAAEMAAELSAKEASEAKETVLANTDQAKKAADAASAAANSAEDALKETEKVRDEALAAKVDVSEVIEEAQKAIEEANNAADSANKSSALADDAATAAIEAVNAADEALISAGNAVVLASSAVEKAENATQKAQEATETANNSIAAANSATAIATQAANTANEKALEATNAAQAANEAAAAVDSAIERTDKATDAANSATREANTAATNAANAAAAANNTKADILAAKERGEFDGKDGASGKDGVPGKDGENGITPHIGTNGNWYIGETDTKKPSRGNDGDDGIGFEWKSEWRYDFEQGGIYSINDIVKYQGNTYIRIPVAKTRAADPDSGDVIYTPDDSDYWELYVPKGEKGADGAPGAKGAKGDKGDTGAKGEKGDSGVYVGSGEVPEGYNVQIDTDGEAVTIPEVLQTVGNSEVDTMSQKAISDRLLASNQGAPTFVQSVNEMTDTSKIYVMPDGHLWAYMKVSGAHEVTKRIDSSNSEFVNNQRLSTSTGELKAAAEFCTSPFIDVSQLPTEFKIKATGIAWYSGQDNTDGYAVALYRENDTPICMYIKTYQSSSHNYKITVVSNNEILIEPEDATKAREYNSIRICGRGVSQNAVIEVIYKSTETEVKWTDTGLTYTPSDYEGRIVELENTSELLEGKINSISESITELDVSPEYVNSAASEVANKVLSVRNAKGFVFGAVSDMHTNGNDRAAISVLHAGMAMNAIQSLTQLDVLCLFGDIMAEKFNDSNKVGFGYVKQCFYNVTKSIPFIQMQGNHDELPADTTEEAQQKYWAYIGANNVNVITDFENQYRNYGYKDFEDRKMRVIYLNSVDVSAGYITNDSYITATQLSWLTNTAMIFSDKTDAEKWAFIVCCHHPLNWYGNIANLLTILNAYKGKSSGSIALDGTTVTYNFVSAKAQFIAHFHGHLHNFRTDTLGTNGVVSITIPNACFYRNNEYGTASNYSDEIHTNYGDVDANGNQRQFNKTADSANDTAFNIVVIDRQSQKIHCINYGAGTDREISY